MHCFKFIHYNVVSRYPLFYSYIAPDFLSNVIVKYALLFSVKMLLSTEEFPIKNTNILQFQDTSDYLIMKATPIL